MGTHVGFGVEEVVLPEGFAVHDLFQVLTDERLVQVRRNFMRNFSRFHTLASTSPGGVICVLNCTANTPRFAALKCVVGNEDLLDITSPSPGYYARERALRLLRHPSHFSSAQSADESLDRGAGAIRAGEFILSFGGFGPPVDEAFMLAVALDSLLIDKATLMHILGLSNNPHCREFGTC